MIKVKLKKTSMLVLVIIVLLLSGGYYFYKYTMVMRSDKKYQNIKLVSAISKSLVLPNEVPTIVSVLNHTKFNNETLRNSSKDGDKLIVFSQSKKLILYRPSSKKVVEVLSIQGLKETQATQDAKTPK